LISVQINWLEATAVGFGLVAVYLATREHVASWPTGIVNVGIFCFLFWRAKLYAGAALQLVYLALSIYGWHQWLRGGAGRTPLPVSRATSRQWAILVPTFLAGGVGLGALLDRYTDSPVPFFDALLTASSLVAQWMLTQKLLENWVVWIVTDAVYVPLLVARGLAFTAAQYAVFLALAVAGLVRWRRSFVARRAAADAAHAAAASEAAGGLTP